MTSPRLGLPDLGVGVGLRVPHYGHVLRERPKIDFFEVISENFMVEGGNPRYHLRRALETYAVVQHGVSLGIAGPAEPDREYLRRLKRVLAEVKSPWVSDHFCWSGSGNAHLHDLLPIPYTEQAIERVVERARMVQDFLEVPFVLENTSSYLTYKSSVMPEWEFIAEVAERAQIGLLFDVNNVYVAAYNHGFDPYDFVENMPHQRIVQIHLAGHTNFGKYIIDTHRGHVIEPVWDLYRRSIELCGAVSTLIEWDDEIPEFSVLEAEAERARAVRNEALSGTRPHTPRRGVPERSASHNAETSLETSHEWLQGGPREVAGEGAGA